MYYAECYEEERNTIFANGIGTQANIEQTCINYAKDTLCATYAYPWKVPHNNKCTRDTADLCIKYTPKGKKYTIGKYNGKIKESVLAVFYKGTF